MSLVLIKFSQNLKGERWCSCCANKTSVIKAGTLDLTTEAHQVLCSRLMTRTKLSVIFRKSVRS
jgi:hypothetical protein